jgi:hypothetical protein
MFIVKRRELARVQLALRMFWQLLSQNASQLDECLLFATFPRKAQRSVGSPLGLESLVNQVLKRAVGAKPIGTDPHWIVDDDSPVRDLAPKPQPKEQPHLLG